MELPFTSFELTFIIIAFLVFSLFGLASVCIEPRYELSKIPETTVEEEMLSSVVYKKTCSIERDDLLKVLLLLL
uniref:Small integral membrane protein 31 n=1 Tax=Oryzias latipes TaxID=8090 RepID=A0A3B3HE59_ORYLA